MQVVVQQIVTGDWEVRWWTEEGLQKRYCTTLETVNATLKEIFYEDED